MKVVYLCLWLCSGTLISGCAFFRPEWIDDRNQFLEEMMGPEILNIYGVFVAISLASAAQIHLSLNYIEEKKGKIYFDGTRRSIKSLCLFILLAFASSVLSLLLKPMIGGHGVAQAVVNGFNHWLLIAYMTLLWDMTRTVLLIRAQVGPSRRQPEERPDDHSTRGSKEGRS